MTFEIRTDDLTAEQTKALLALHLQGMRANSPAEHVFALDLSGLQSSEITVWTAWIGGSLISIGALKMLNRESAEIKSMRTHPDHLRKGAATALLRHILEQARERGLKRLSLETGRGESFEPALRLYRRHGFIFGEAFSDYQAGDFSQFMHLTL